MLRILSALVLTFVFLLMWPSPKAFARTTKIESVGTFGPIDLQVGVEVVGQLDSSQASEIAHYFSGTKIYVKVVDPSSSLFSSANFTSLSAKGFRWYLTFSSSSAASSALSQFAASGKTQGAVIELKESAISSVSSLKSQYPQFLFHAAEYAFWPREKVKELVHNRPEVEAVSMYVDGPGGNVFGDARLMFDTFYDASRDIPGTSIKINYPAGKKLSLSSIRMKSSSPAGEAFAAAVVGDVLTSNAQGGTAPFRYVNLGRFKQYSTSLKETFANLAKAIEGKPSLIWPRAAGPNGNPYDNEYPGWENSNSKPVMGAILKGSSGTFSMIVNASGDTQNITVNGTPVSLSPYQVYRSGGGAIGPAPIVPTDIVPTHAPKPPPVEDGQPQPPPEATITYYIPPAFPFPTAIPTNAPIFPTSKPFTIETPDMGPNTTDTPSAPQPTYSPQKNTSFPPAQEVVRTFQGVLELPKKGLSAIYLWDRFLEIYAKIWIMKFTSAFQK